MGSSEDSGSSSPTTTTSTASAGPSFAASLVAGGMAGTSVDVALYPIDTLKTRLQAPGGFWKAGGFRGIYQGLGAVALGSAPGAALFFSTYEQSKQVLASQNSVFSDNPAVVHMTAASCGEVMACLVRVPTEVVKGRLQTASQSQSRSIWQTVQTVWNEPLHAHSTQPGGLAGLYRGFGITLFREIPFSMIQFPLYEWLKLSWRRNWNNDRPISAVAAAACGSFSGAVAGALTTPLDVLKTRYMLGADQHGRRYAGIWDVLQRTVQAEGPVALLHGIQPRVFWISLGGFVFFGAYETSLRIVNQVL